MKITVNVTQDDIDHGEQGQCHKCPIALAIQRVLPGQHVEVDNNKVLFVDQHGVRTDVSLPNEAQCFILNFDNGWDAYPFSFELEIPDAT